MHVSGCHGTFPAPTGPMIAMSSPRLMLNVSPSSMGTLPTMSP